MEWSEIALPVGSPEQGFLGLQLHFVLPPDTCKSPASSRQEEAVGFFYEREFGSITASQANTLLACREYARLCSDSIFKEYSLASRNLLARGIASYILDEPEILNFVIEWSKKNFAKGVTSPRVCGTPYFMDVFNFASYLEGMIEMNGWTRKQLKTL